jgi:hypothetical protein
MRYYLEAWFIGNILGVIIGVVAQLYWSGIL